MSEPLPITNMKTPRFPDAELNEFVDKVLVLFPRMMRGFMREERNALSRGRIPLPQFWFLQLLSERGVSRMRDLTQELRIPPSTATMLTDRLVEMRLVSRESDREDRRAIRVRLTAKGRSMMARVVGQKRDILLRVMAGLPAGDRAAYVRVLEHVVRGAGAPGKGATR